RGTWVLVVARQLHWLAGDERLRIELGVELLEDVGRDLVLGADRAQVVARLDRVRAQRRLRAPSASAAAAIPSSRGRTADRGSDDEHKQDESERQRGRGGYSHGWVIGLLHAVNAPVGAGILPTPT